MQKDQLDRVQEALNDERFKWRTADGVAKQVGLQKCEVMEAFSDLAQEGVVIRSSVASPKGDELYSTRERFKQFAPVTEKLGAMLRNRAS